MCLGCDHPKPVTGCLARHRVSFRPGCRGAVFAPLGGRIARARLPRAGALRGLQRRLTTFKGKDGRFGLARPGRGITPLHMPRPGLRAKAGPGNVLLDAGEGNLPKRSAVVVSQVSSVEKARLGERIGSLSDSESG